MTPPPILLSIQKTASRTQWMNCTRPYLNFPIAIVTTSEKNFLDSTDKLFVKPVVAVKDSAVSLLLQRNYPQISPSRCRRRGSI